MEQTLASYDAFSNGSIWEYFVEGEKMSCSSVGFVELLNMQDFGDPSVMDVLKHASAKPFEKPSSHLEKEIEENGETNEVVNSPATPNSSSISSEFSGGWNKDRVKEKHKRKTSKELKPKKTNLKRQREPRFAFMTKSEVDHLEDGYRWRKYGQKAVKNSTFPRSYYKCTSASCNVKKRVERSCQDPTTVVTTYEGQHTHPSPVMARPNAATPMYSNLLSSLPPEMMILAHNQQQILNYSVPVNCGLRGLTTSLRASGGQPIQFCPEASGFLTDQGLLQDMVLPWSALKDEEQS